MAEGGHDKDRQAHSESSGTFYQRRKIKIF